MIWHVFQNKLIARDVETSLRRKEVLFKHNAIDLAVTENSVFILSDNTLFTFDISNEKLRQYPLAKQDYFGIICIGKEVFVIGARCFVFSIKNKVARRTGLEIKHQILGKCFHQDSIYILCLNQVSHTRVLLVYSVNTHELKEVNLGYMFVRKNCLMHIENQEMLIAGGTWRNTEYDRSYRFDLENLMITRESRLLKKAACMSTSVCLHKNSISFSYKDSMHVYDFCRNKWRHYSEALWPRKKNLLLIWTYSFHNALSGVPLCLIKEIIWHFM